MSVKAKLREMVIQTVYLRRLGGRWAKPLIRSGAWRLPGASVDQDGRLVVPGLGVAIPQPNRIGIALVKGMRFALALRERVGAELAIREDEIEVAIGGIRMVALSEVDLSVMHEVFGESLYSFQVPGRYVFIDIGANIGASALFFAERYQGEVHAFELVPSTADIARKNIELNPDLAKSIHLFAFGLSDRDGEFDIPVDPAFRPSNSLHAPVLGPTQTVEHVLVRDAGAVLDEIIAKLDGRGLVLKLDAEGAEYEILDRLAQSGALKQVNILLLEWHLRSGKDPAELRELLKAAGFQWFERLHDTAPVGFITAFR